MTAKKTVMKHKSDDGDLSIIAEADSILIACTGGHYWILDAEMHTVPKSGGGAGNIKAKADIDLADMDLDLAQFGSRAMVTQLLSRE